MSLGVFAQHPRESGEDSGVLLSVVLDSKQVEWSFSYVHAFQHKEEGPTLIGDTATLKMYQNAYGVSFGYKL